MIKQTAKQTGSAHVIVISVIVLAIVGALGFVFWNSYINKKPAPVVSQTKTVSQTNSAVQKDQPAAQELKIDDWSIKFTVPSGLAVGDIYYYKAHIGDSPDYYGFTTNRVRAQGGMCDSEVTGNLIMLTRSTAKTGASTPINQTPINGYYYYSDTTDGGITPMPQCLATDAANNDRALLSQLVASIRAE